MVEGCAVKRSAAVVAEDVARSAKKLKARSSEELEWQAYKEGRSCQTPKKDHPEEEPDTDDKITEGSDIGVDAIVEQMEQVDFAYLSSPYKSSVMHDV